MYYNHAALKCMQLQLNSARDSALTMPSRRLPEDDVLEALEFAAAAATGALEGAGAGAGEGAGVAVDAAAMATVGGG